MMAKYVGSKSGSQFTRDRCYRVFEVLTIGGNVHLRILDDQDHTPGLYDEEEFQIVDAREPVSWKTELSDNGTRVRGYAELIEEGFWDSFFDGDGQSKEIFSKIAKPLNHIRFDREFVKRFTSVSWSTVSLLVNRGFLPIEFVPDIAVSEMLRGNNEEKIVHLAGLGARNGEEIKEILNFLSHDERDSKLETAGLIAAYVVENASEINNVEDLYEDFYMNYRDAMFSGECSVQQFLPAADVKRLLQVILADKIYEKIILPSNVNI
jgi:hypothetical protein